MGVVEGVCVVVCLGGEGRVCIRRFMRVCGMRGFVSVRGFVCVFVCLFFTVICMCLYV